jgi:hypothetical protein
VSASRTDYHTDHQPVAQMCELFVKSWSTFAIIVEHFELRSTDNSRFLVERMVLLGCNFQREILFKNETTLSTWSNLLKLEKS